MNDELLTCVTPKALNLVQALGLPKDVVTLTIQCNEGRDARPTVTCTSYDGPASGTVTKTYVLQKPDGGETLNGCSPQINDLINALGLPKHVIAFTLHLCVKTSQIATVSCVYHPVVSQIDTAAIAKLAEEFRPAMVMQEFHSPMLPGAGI